VYSFLELWSAKEVEASFVDHFYGKMRAAYGQKTDEPDENAESAEPVEIKDYSIKLVEAEESKVDNGEEIFN
jgi:hypothetical protein